MTIALIVTCLIAALLSRRAWFIGGAFAVGISGLTSLGSVHAFREGAPLIWGVGMAAIGIVSFAAAVAACAAGARQPGE